MDNQPLAQMFPWNHVSSQMTASQPDMQNPLQPFICNASLPLHIRKDEFSGNQHAPILPPTPIAECSNESPLIVGTDSIKNPKKRLGQRKGKWTPEEELYTNKVIEFFNAGLLKLDDSDGNITLRSYLAEKLDCDPMRITKKYTGAACLGKRVYHFDQNNVNADDVERAMEELKKLETDFRQKLEQMNKKRNHDPSCQELEYSQTVSTPAIDALVKRFRFDNGLNKSLHSRPSPVTPTSIVPSGGNSLGIAMISSSDLNITRADDAPHRTSFHSGMPPPLMPPAYFNRRESAAPKEVITSRYPPTPYSRIPTNSGYPPMTFSSSTSNHLGQFPPNWGTYQNPWVQRHVCPPAILKAPALPVEVNNANSYDNVTSTSKVESIQDSTSSIGSSSSHVKPSTTLVLDCHILETKSYERLEKCNTTQEDVIAASLQRQGIDVPSNSFLGFLNQLQKLGNQDDLTDFFEGIQNSMMQTKIPSPLKAANRLASKESAESLVQLAGM